MSLGDFVGLVIIVMAVIALGCVMCGLFKEDKAEMFGEAFKAALKEEFRAALKEDRDKNDEQSL